MATVYNSEQPGFHILICMIEVWDQVSPKEPMTKPSNPLILTEVESIEIEESYKKLIGTASVKFPRGSVVRKTVTVMNEEEIKNSKQLQASIDSSGVLMETRTTTTAMTPESFKVDQRIRISLGYTTDPKIAAMAKINNTTGKSVYNDFETRSEYTKHLNVMFDGYITKLSIDTPIELHCESLLSCLKDVTCPNKISLAKGTVNDLLAPDGRYKLLKDTGIILHPSTQKLRFDLGRLELTDDLTLADVFDTWARFGLHAILTEYNGQPAIKIGRSYFSDAENDSIVNISGLPSGPVKIYFDYNVASNNLTLCNTNKKFLAVQATGCDINGHFIHLTLIQNPQYDGVKIKDKWRIVNDSKVSKKQLKKGIKPLSKSKDRVRMDKYNKVTYISKKNPITLQQLQDEAIKYYESYNANGIEGSLVLFGDLHLKTAQKVELIDNRFPQKNGIYVIDEVNTTFGTKGYRQTIKLPYKLKNSD